MNEILKQAEILSSSPMRLQQSFSPTPIQKDFNYDMQLNIEK